MEPWQLVDRADPDLARRLLATCCGSSRWIDRMLARRPFGSQEALLSAAREQWLALDPTDWREAFAHHPRIGDVDALKRRFAATRHLSEREQRGVASASEDVLMNLAEENRAYEQKFGYIFIVCADGKTAAEMLTLLRGRIANRPEIEIHIAAEEQARITELRLKGLSSRAPHG
jgi:2-oxo-4-hydroxy-4-carboxy-5-ureidoimidazoline decarboxylase